ncbi:hypothetical protein [Motilimonas pumila]|uniref:DUF2946 domain-containing protein n=1 Tax=Motilimonas pumila TaxID=2303987 RepID=A0A418YH71_9GAMM|nr:hypothetical protein [Motilimonas pumila]RJG49445.1 hypothetical protein D1Z90_05670 [Motilimonas pumila]
MQQAPAYLLSVSVLLMTLAASSSVDSNGKHVFICGQAGFFPVVLADTDGAQAISSSYCPMCLGFASVFISPAKLSQLAAQSQIDTLSLPYMAVPLWHNQIEVKPPSRAPPTQPELIFG